MKKISGYIITSGLLTAPFLIIAHRYGQLNPYHLSGPHFLIFFISHSLGIHAALILWTRQRAPRMHPSPLFPKMVIALSMLIGISRMVQV